MLEAHLKPMVCLLNPMDTSKGSITCHKPVNATPS
jgi:hypothetical protein